MNVWVHQPRLTLIEEDSVLLFGDYPWPVQQFTSRLMFMLKLWNRYVCVCVAFIPVLRRSTREPSKCDCCQPDCDGQRPAPHTGLEHHLPHHFWRPHRTLLHLHRPCVQWGLAHYCQGGVWSRPGLWNPAQWLHHVSLLSPLNLLLIPGIRWFQVLIVWTHLILHLEWD